MSKDEKKPRQMPKGGRKGGTIFPRVSLQDSLGYAKKLVSKTHVAPQPEDVIHSGVVGAKSGKGAVRISSLRQYGLLSGDKASNYTATELAKKISSAPPEDLVALYRKAALLPSVFKAIFATFHGDAVTKAKLRQRAADLKVHPEETETCVDLYLSAMTIAQLATVDGDKVTHVADTQGPLASNSDGDSDTHSAEEILSEHSVEGEGPSGPGESAGNGTDSDESSEGEVAGQSNSVGLASGPRAVFNVNVTLDSSLDIEKLQKQLELLKRFGAI